MNEKIMDFLVDTLVEATKGKVTVEIDGDKARCEFEGSGGVLAIALSMVAKTIRETMASMGLSEDLANGLIAAAIVTDPPGPEEYEYNDFS